MKPLVFNSTPLIYLTKVGLSNVLEGLTFDKITSPCVRKEVVEKGKRKGVPDAVVLEKLFTKNVFKVCTPKDEKFLIQLSETKGFHIADAEVLALAKEGGYFAVIDDEVERPKIYGIHYVGTPYILMQAVYEGIISKNDAKQAVNDMVSAGWRCNVESYAKIIEILEKI